jgi:hypothetical protein
MPAMRRYRVTETREVEVDANNAVDATRIAGLAFEKGQNPDNGVTKDLSLEGVWGNTVNRIRTIDISTMED